MNPEDDTVEVRRRGGRQLMEPDALVVRGANEHSIAPSDVNVRVRVQSRSVPMLSRDAGRSDEARALGNAELDGTPSLETHDLLSKEASDRAVRRGVPGHKKLQLERHADRAPLCPIRPEPGAGSPETGATLAEP